MWALPSQLGWLPSIGPISVNAQRPARQSGVRHRAAQQHQHGPDAGFAHLVLPPVGLDLILARYTSSPRRIFRSTESTPVQWYAGTLAHATATLSFLETCADGSPDSTGLGSVCVVDVRPRAIRVLVGQPLGIDPATAGAKRLSLQTTGEQIDIRIGGRCGMGQDGQSSPEFIWISLAILRFAYRPRTFLP